MSSKFDIKLTIAGKSYPMTIDRENEERYRRAEKEINELIAKFRSRFKADGDDYLAMAALQIALAKVELEMSRSLGEDLDELHEIEKTLGDCLAGI